MVVQCQPSENGYLNISSSDEKNFKRKPGRPRRQGMSDGHMDTSASCPASRWVVSSHKNVKQRGTQQFLETSSRYQGTVMGKISSPKKNSEQKRGRPRTRQMNVELTDRSQLGKSYTDSEGGSSKNSKRTRGLPVCHLADDARLDISQLCNKATTGQANVSHENPKKRRGRPRSRRWNGDRVDISQQIFGSRVENNSPVKSPGSRCNFQCEQTSVDHIDTVFRGCSTSVGKPKRKGATSVSQTCKSRSVLLRTKKKAASAVGEKRYPLRSLLSVPRILRSKSHDKPNNLFKGGIQQLEQNARGRKRRKRISKRITGNMFDELRRRLRYFVGRISFEQNLLDVYASDGWKGHSLEKVKPLKELERASSRVLQYKLKIRGLFESIDNLCSQGKFPECLFDSEGQIESEDIFCAKCGSKDLTLDNDIVLCDGACDRGFHQMCLEPSLLKEQIPPDEEGWLCPGCDCKVDCVDLLNEFFGTDLSVEDDWEKVFPEAAEEAADSKMHSLMLAPDDSEDFDYAPDGQTDDSASEDKLSSPSNSFDIPEFDDLISTSGAKAHERDLLLLDDSEDEDFDPDHPESGERTGRSDMDSDAHGSSSDTDDLDDPVLQNGSDMLSAPLIPKPEQHLSYKRKKKCDQTAEVTLLEDNISDLNAAGKRVRVRLDYKKLYEEEYGRASPSSSDEDWTEVKSASSKRWTNDVKGESTSDVDVEVKDVIYMNGNCPGELKMLKEGNTDGNLTKYKRIGTSFLNNLKKEREEDNNYHQSTEACSSSRKRFGVQITEKLVSFLKENAYPSKAEKEKLAKDLGITLQQVSRWFTNSRSSMRFCTKSKRSKEDRGMDEVKVEKSYVNDPDTVESEGNNHIVVVQDDLTLDDKQFIKTSAKKLEREFQAVAIPARRKQIEMPGSSWTKNTAAGTPLLRRSMRRKSPQS